MISSELCSSKFPSVTWTALSGDICPDVGDARAPVDEVWLHDTIELTCKWHWGGLPVTMSGYNSQDERDYPHYAMIYIDHNGNLRHESSPSVANNFPNPQVTNEFLRAVARSGEASPSHSQRMSHTPADINVVS